MVIRSSAATGVHALALLIQSIEVQGSSSDASRESAFKVATNVRNAAGLAARWTTKIAAGCFPGRERQRGTGAVFDRLKQRGRDRKFRA